MEEKSSICMDLEYVKNPNKRPPSDKRPSYTLDPILHIFHIFGYISAKNGRIFIL